MMTWTMGTLAAASMALAAAGDVKRGVDAWQRGDVAGAVATWRPLAERGDPDAQFNLAQAYKLGRGVPANLDTALGLYRKAAAQGHEEAGSLLGLLLFQNGKRAEAMPYIKLAAERGEPSAQYVYGTALANGDIVAQDLPRAYAMMSKAAQQGLTPAKQTLADMDRQMPLEARQEGRRLAGTFRTQTVVADPGPPPTPRATAVARTPARPPARTVAAPVRSTPVVTSTPPVRGWRVQLGAFSQPANANQLFASLKGRVPALASAQAYLIRAGAVTRLQAGPFANRAAADRACAAVKAKGQACFAVGP